MLFPSPQGTGEDEDSVESSSSTLVQVGHTGSLAAGLYVSGIKVTSQCLRHAGSAQPGGTVT